MIKANRNSIRRDANLDANLLEGTALGPWAFGLLFMDLLMRVIGTNRHVSVLTVRGHILGRPWDGTGPTV
jgi:hypothetical protein